VDLLIKVEEVEKKGQFFVGGGYNTVSGLQGDIQFFKDNLWGEGKKIGIDWQFAKKNNEYNITYLDRWWGDTPIHLEPRFYNRKDIYNKTGEDYEKETAGIEMKVGRPIWKFSNIYISLRDEKIDISDIGGMPEGVEEGQKTSRSLKFILDRNTRVRDEAFNPYQGSYSSISADITGGPVLGGDFAFIKYKGEWRGYLRKSTFWKYPIIAYRLRIKSGKNMPVYEKFHIGGMETLRGYKENEFTGEELILGNLELRLPLDKDFLASLFIDIGQIRDEDSYVSKLGWGFGIRIKTIIGFIRLDYGIGEEGGQLYFGMGEGF
jgi:outer membrane protein insertion porin family